MYVFGIDMPIMEILFTVMMFMIIALVIIMWEVRKMRKLILTEQQDIIRFESDISKIESPSSTLTEYVTQSLKRGMKKTDIERTLLKKGWPQKNIKKALSGAN